MRRNLPVGHAHLALTFIMLMRLEGFHPSVRYAESPPQPTLVSETSRIYNAGLELLVGVDAGAKA